MGMVSPATGRVMVAGRNLADVSGRERLALQRLRQVVLQDPYSSLDPRMKVGNIIAEPLRHGAEAPSRQAVRERVAELLKLVGLPPNKADLYPHQFSGGQRQRISIARAPAPRPQIIVLDEPTSALDVSVQAQTLNLMRDLQQRFGLTYLFISHNLAVVRHMANRIGVMYLGRLVEVADAPNLFGAPKHPYTRMLLAAVPDLTLSGRARKPAQGEPPNPLEPPAGCPFHPRCPHARERCRIELPQLIEAHGTRVACHGVQEGWLPDGTTADA
jgi:peptide/nickel transport system ATP-binding protein